MGAARPHRRVQPGTVTVRQGTDAAARWFRPGRLGGLDRPNGWRAPVLNHLLKAYLLDASREVREMYSISCLHPAVLLERARR